MCKSCEAIEIFVANVTEFPSGSNKDIEIKGLVFSYDSKLDVVMIPEIMREGAEYIDRELFEMVKREKEQESIGAEVEKIANDLMPDNLDNLPAPLKMISVMGAVKKAKELYGKGYRAPKQEKNEG